jgi:hypothetical protein
MALQLETQAEILPGYKLLSKLGSGGYGEVWKCEAPGGLLKAIKIIHADLDPESDKRTEQELSALRRVQAVRHPYLLSIDRYDIVDGRLVIVTELADCNLWDRFSEFRQLRQAGIPRDDLLRYIYEAAEVLDLMNNQYQLQHLDIKPQNLFLVHDHVKVADFGLVRDLDGVKRVTAGGATPVYAAPESFEGIITPYCDQYSLAIVYQELLTGKRPFSATNLQQLIAQHLQAAPDLSPLPPNDRAAVAKALCKRPDDRHASCRDFARGLMTGNSTVVTPPPSAPLRPTLPTVLPSPDDVLLPAAWTGGDTPATQVLYRRDEQPTATEALPLRTAPPEQHGDGVLFPALVVGIGGVALDVLHRVKQSLVERVGGMDRIPNVRLLFIDTDPETTQRAMDETTLVPLFPEEVFAARLNRPAHYLKPRRNGRSLLEGWFDSQVLYRVKAGNPLTQGVRSLGRLAFCDHFRLFEHKLKTDLETVTHQESIDHAEIHSQLGMRSNRPRIYIVAGLAGGTGGGMFIDVAYTARRHLKLLGYEDPEIVGVFLLPPHAGPFAKPHAVGNAYAALTELNHFSIPGITYTACIDDKEMTLLDQAPPFSRFILLPIRSTDPQIGDVPGMAQAAEFLWRDLITPFGRAADTSRAEARSMPGVTPEPTTVAGQTFGMYAVTWPRRQLAERTARWLVLRVVASWASTDTRSLGEPVNAWVQEHWNAQHLGPDDLMTVCQQVCEQVIGEPMEKYLAELAEPFAPRGRWGRGSYDSSGAFQALNKVVQLVGSPNDVSGQRINGRLEQALAAQAETMIREAAAKVAHLAECLIEQPGFRLAGAEVAIQVMEKMVKQVFQRLDPQLRDHSTQAQRALLKLQQTIETDVRRKAGNDIAENLKSFGRARYHYLLGRSVLNTFGRMQDQLADSIKEVALCRTRLLEMCQRLDPGPLNSTMAGTLLPDGCNSIQEAVEMYRDSMDQEAINDLDRQMQALIEKQFTTLVQVCITSTDVRINLEAALMQLARKYMHQRSARST